MVSWPNLGDWPNLLLSCGIALREEVGVVLSRAGKRRGGLWMRCSGRGLFGAAEGGEESLQSGWSQWEL